VKQQTHEYYAALQRDYAGTIRQLVPRYDEMVDCITTLVLAGRPGTVLDIGTGIGNLSAVLLDALPAVRVTAVDASPEMAAEAAGRLAPHGDRATVLTLDVTALEPPHPFDAVLSNLVLHNLPQAEKRGVLGAVAAWLTPNGRFVWGDFIRHPDPGVQQHVEQERTAFALAQGCPTDLVRWNFEKESREDHPLTIPETLAALEAAGLRHPDVVWAHDAFAVFLARAP
jgi:SAM-dependent methyltransferase